MDRAKENKMGNLMEVAMDVTARDVDLLKELALDLQWSWSRAGDELWERLDPAIWKLTQNPWLILQTVSRERLAVALSDTSFREQLEAVAQKRRQAEAAPSWFKMHYPSSRLSCVAYFSMEFMLSEALPIYSGGLGNVAGDQLKAASELGVPVVGVGLLYQQGYFRQVIDGEGRQEALYPYNDPGQLPIQPVRQANGEWLRVELAFPEYSIWLRAWQARVGRATLYLLDSNDPANFPAHRTVTSELYGGGPNLRLQQELILGIGGWLLLRALGLKPEVCHLNEGHAAFAVLARAHSFMQENYVPFEVALAATRAGNLFTTHTAVEAGFDRFPADMIVSYLQVYAKVALGISMKDLLALGRQNPDNDAESFNMAYLAIHSSAAVNAVSRLHGVVSRKLFQPLFPRWPQEEVPVDYVTNGVHVPSWDSPPADALWSRACGEVGWQDPAETLQKKIEAASDLEIWDMRTACRRTLVEKARARLAREKAIAAQPSDAIEAAKHLLDPTALTLGFARRFATYKRPNLLLQDPDRLLRILTNPQRPVQLVIAGKAHPADGFGQALIQDWIRFILRPEARPHVVFLSDYDMQVSKLLVQGADVWINTPRRPWEACGTSGMKVLANGVLNCSELDGWWAEAYMPEVGWALGDGTEHDQDPAWDAAEAASLYELLEREIVPEFYSRNDAGIPTAWVKRIRQSMARLTPQYSAHRAVREYTEKHYLPAATAYRDRAEDQGALAKDLVSWRHRLDEKWGRLRFGDLRVETVDDKHLFHIQVYLPDIDPEMVQVELVAGGVKGMEFSKQAMSRDEGGSGSSGFYLYKTSVPASRPATDYTPRVVPRFGAAALPLETPLILWKN
jgi:starch phosphorylase